MLTCSLLVLVSKASTYTEALFLETEPASTSIELYLTVGTVVVNFNLGCCWQYSDSSSLIFSQKERICGMFFLQICVNDDLVAKKFAYYSSKSVDSSKLNEEEPFSHMSVSIVPKTVSTMSTKQTVPTEPPPGKRGSQDELLLVCSSVGVNVLSADSQSHFYSQETFDHTT